jgi:hypothetical protein
MMRKLEARDDPPLRDGVMTLIGTSRVKRRPNFKSRLVDGELVVLDREQGLIHQLNKTASFIWEQCDGQRTAAEIAGHVCEAFEVEQSTALNDVLVVLNKLHDLNLIDKL